MGMAIMGIGMIIAMVGSIWLLVEAFKTSVLWGLGSMFVPFVSLFFLIKHWDVAKKPFLISLCAIPFYIVGVILAPDLTVQAGQ